MSWIILIILFVSNCHDAISEGMIERIHYGWWEYHRVRWTAMFSLWGFLSYLWLKENWHSNLALFLFVCFTICCSVAWRAIYKHYDIKKKSFAF